MVSRSHATAPTRFLEADGIRFAYRRFGNDQAGNLPLVFLNYFSANMDSWDPALTDGFAADREVILFNNAGVANSGGETPTTVPAMMLHFLSFLQALGLGKTDIVGFSLGGMIAQQTALDRPEVVRRLILLGTGPRGGESMTYGEISLDEARANPEKLLLGAFFSPTPASQAAGHAYMQRLEARREERDPPVSRKAAQAQLAALMEWGTVPARDRYADLDRIMHKILVVHGSDDHVVLPINALILAQQLPEALLIVYPDSRHGAQSQHSELFLKHARLFLNE